MTRIAETDIMRPVVRHFESMDGFDVYPEVRIPRYQRRVDLVADDGLTLIAVEGKAQLDDVVIEQARQLQGISDFTYVAVPYVATPSGAWIDRFERCVELEIGVLTVPMSKHVVVAADALRNFNADPGILRACLHEGQKGWAEAGSKSGEWTKEAEYYAKFEQALRQGPIPKRMVQRFVGRSPWKSNVRTVRAITDAIYEGRVKAVDAGQDFKAPN